MDDFVEKKPASEIRAFDRDTAKHFEEDGKEAINKLLWEYLPCGTTLYEADKLACLIHEMIDERWIDRRREIEE
jgi:hypothetical protein